MNGFSTHAGRLAAWLAVFCVPAISQGHDTWVQASARAVSPEDVVHVSLMLGNHGNHHRDFTLAGKLSSLDDATVEVISPEGQRTDLIPSVIDLGYAPTEGYYAARYIPGVEGLHVVSHTLDTLHRTTRAVKSAKTYFLASE